MYVGLAVGGSIECTLYQVFLHRRTGTFGILMEQEHTLGQLTVVQALLEEHVGHHLLILSFLDKVLDALSLVLTADGVERIVEGKLLDVVEVLLLEGRGGHVVVGIKEGKHILEHT